MDQLYAEFVGAAGQRTVTKESDASASATAEGGLARFFAAIAELRGRSTVEVRRKKTETFQVASGPLDRASDVLAALKSTVPPVGTRGDGLFWYSLPTRLVPRRIGNRNVIEVSCEQQELAFEGVTSPEHWGSTSLLNNLLLAAAKSPDHAVPVFGLAFPLPSSEMDGRTRMQVQFIILASPRKWVS